MPTCCVPMCSSRDKHLFRIPKAAHRYEQWCRNIPKKDREFRAGRDMVCEDHFTPDLIMKNFEVPEIGFALPREKIRLKNNAVPTIFPDCLKYRTNHPIKPKEPPERRCFSSATAIKMAKNENELPVIEEAEDKTLESKPLLESSMPLLESSMPPLESSTPPLESSMPSLESSQSTNLSQNISTAEEVRTPPGWSSVFVDEHRLFIHWLCHWEIDKKVVLDKNLNTQVFLGKVLLPIIGFEQLQNIQDLEKLLVIVDDIKTCENIFSDEKCHGYRTKKSTNCAYCLLKKSAQRRKEVLASRKKEKKSKKVRDSLKRMEQIEMTSPHFVLVSHSME